MILNPSQHLLAATLILSGTLVWAAPPDRVSFAQQDRPIEGVPVEAFELSDPELQIEIWARSPLVYSPVAMDCDSAGRLWVTEGIDYNSGRRIEAGRSIMVLSDTDGDGRADSSHPFVTEKGLRHAPLGIAVFDNRIVLSATPSIIVYTDVDRNAVFDPKIDKREVFLTGFRGGGHDHSLHAVVGSPSGQWYFSYGNCGANVTTADGRTFRSGSYYGSGSDLIGKRSSDGHLYIGGAMFRINPDGTGMAPVAHNMRNPHDSFVTSFGDILQSDNDDPAHCRVSWVMEHANLGYADLADGSRSWEESAKSWEETQPDLSFQQKGAYGGVHGRAVRASASHWREFYPGVFPPGQVYGAGSPTGNVFIEGDGLGRGNRGTYLVSDMVRKEVMASKPTPRGAEVEIGSLKPFLRLRDGAEGEHFLPTDLVLGPDGSLFISDFYNDTSRRTNQVSGTIYRISRRDSKPSPVTVADFETPVGLMNALRSPTVGVRTTAVPRIVERGSEMVGPLVELLNDRSNPYLRARAPWVLAQLGKEGVGNVEALLAADDERDRLLAFRALRFARPDGLLELANTMAKDPSAAVRREVAVSLRDVPFDKSRSILKSLIEGYDGENRYYLEALGVAATGKEREVYLELVKPMFTGVDFANWDARARNLAWRMFTSEAIADLDQVLRASGPDLGEFRHLAMAFARFRSDTDRADRIEKLTALAVLPKYAAEEFQITVNEIVEKDLTIPEPELLRNSFPMPKSFGQETEVSDVATISALEGDFERGRNRAATCLACHKIEGNGIAFGPNLTNWGQTRSIDEIVRDIVHPSKKLAHGYDTPARLTSGPHVAEGMLSNYSYHAGSLKLKLFGGETRKFLFRKSGARLERLKSHSWMPPASKMGLDDQSVRDIAEYLHRLGGEQARVIKSGPKLETGKGPGWVALDGDDFLNVNCHPDTWRWEGGHVFCNGKPTGVIRYRKPLTNFEFVCEWMHKKSGGNSGVFVWATPQSLRNCVLGRGRLPQGIEVQVLDLGYREIYERQHKKPSDWFTSHGDVFPVGPIKMTPFPPVAPDGRRSFPSAETTRGIFQWNHYHIRAVDGVMRLTVNGVEVSGGEDISPAAGYLCLESEGAPIEFRNLRLKVLPPEVTVLKGAPEIPVPAPVVRGAKLDLKGHPILGTWAYLNGYSREFFADGTCILRQNGREIWKRGVEAKSDTTVTLEGGLRHGLKGDELHIEGKYVAKRAEP